jgi:hypothetical protein
MNDFWKRQRFAKDTNNSSSTPISLCVKLSHGELMQWNTSVAFSNTFQACHTVFLPFQLGGSRYVCRQLCHHLSGGVGK